MRHEILTYLVIIYESSVQVFHLRGNTRHCSNIQRAEPQVTCERSKLCLHGANVVGICFDDQLLLHRLLFQLLFEALISNIASFAATQENFDMAKVCVPSQQSFSSPFCNRSPAPFL